MKKIIVLLALIIAVGFTACNENGNKTADPDLTEYTITFDANGGTGGPSTAKAILDKPMPAITGAPTWEGHTFNGYFSAKTGGTKYYNADLTSAKNWDKKQAATIYAQWTSLPHGKYAITFDQNEGTGGPSTATATFEEPMPAITGAPTREGYTFNGYFDALTDGKKYYNADLTSAADWDKEAGATLYAQWTPKTFAITFNVNGGTGGPTTATATFGQPMPTITNVPTLSGNVFAGYYDAQTAGVMYYNADLTSAKNWDKNDAATLYARWTPIPAGSFLITFNASGGTGGPTTVVAEYGKAMPTLTAQVPTKAGLYFVSTNNGMTVDSNVGAEDEGGWYFKGYFEMQDSATATTVGKQYYDADLKPIGNWDKQADTTLYALFIGKYDKLVPFVETAPVIDGNGNDPAWEKAEWIPINQVWMGNGNATAGTAANKYVPTGPTADDFTGRFKMVWTADKLYYLAEITDDVLRQVNTWQSGNMYQDDILELFIDEDASGGAYGGASSLGTRTRYNAFAHHMAITGNNGMYITGSTDGGYVLLNHMTDYVIGNKDNANGSNLYTWEVGLLIVKDDYVHNRTTPASPTTMNVISLTAGKKMGFAVAYCDSDNKTNSGNREHFMGSVFCPRQDKNQAYQSANVFAKMYLVK